MIKLNCKAGIIKTVYFFSNFVFFFPGDPPTSFFNASVISFTNTNQQFLAAMVPNPNSIENFWQMIIEKKVCTIISFEPTSYIFDCIRLAS